MCNCATVIQLACAVLTSYLWVRIRATHTLPMMSDNADIEVRMWHRKRSDASQNYNLFGMIETSKRFRKMRGSLEEPGNGLESLLMYGPLPRTNMSLYQT